MISADSSIHSKEITLRLKSVQLQLTQRFQFVYSTQKKIVIKFLLVIYGLKICKLRAINIEND